MGVIDFIKFIRNWHTYTEKKTQEKKTRNVFIDNLMDISDIELEFIIFIRVKIIIHVYIFCCKMYVATLKKN